MAEGMGPWFCPRTDHVGEGSKDKSTRQAPGLGRGQSRVMGRSTAQGWAGSGAEAEVEAEVAGTGVRERHLPLQPQEDSVKMERNMR